MSYIKRRMILTNTSFGIVFQGALGAQRVISHIGRTEKVICRGHKTLTDKGIYINIYLYIQLS